MNLLVSLRQVNTGGSIVARSTCAFINVDLTTRSGESSRAETFGPVVDGNAEASMLADSLTSA